MNVFDLRQQLIDDYAAYTRSFFQVADARIRDHVERALGDRTRAQQGGTPAAAIRQAQRARRQTPRDNRISGTFSSMPNDSSRRSAPGST